MPNHVGTHRHKQRKSFQEPSLQRHKREQISTHLTYFEAKNAILGLENAQIRKIKDGFKICIRKPIKSA